MRAAPQPSATARPGFTLLEIMVTTAISVVVLGVLMQMLAQGGDLLARNVDIAALQRQSRPISEWFGEDLRNMAPAGALARDNKNESRHELILLVNDPRVGEVGQTCLIRYYTAVTDDRDHISSGPNSARRLYRKRLSPEQTMNILREGDSVDWLSDGRLAPKPEEDDRLADRVVEFSVNGMLWPPAGGNLLEWNSSVPSSGNGNGQKIDATEIAHLEITLRVLSEEESLQRIRKGDWSSRPAPREGRPIVLRWSASSAPQPPATPAQP